MAARMEAIFFGITAFLITVQFLLGFADFANSDSVVSSASRQAQVRSASDCKAPTTAKAAAMRAEQGKA